MIYLFWSNISTHSSIEFNTVCVSLFNTIMCLFKWRTLCTVPAFCPTYFVVCLVVTCEKFASKEKIEELIFEVIM